WAGARARSSPSGTSCRRATGRRGRAARASQRTHGGPKACPRVAGSYSQDMSDACETSAMTVARDEFFGIMSAFPTGVAIVTTLEPDGIPRGLTTNAVTSVSADPPILLVCVDRSSRTLPALLHSKRFVVNFMRDDCAGLCGLFASKADDKFDQVSWSPGLGGV